MFFTCIKSFLLACIIAGGFAAVSCKNSNSVIIPKLSYLQADTVQRFRVGEQFILSVRKNSCCMNCWKGDVVLQNELPVSSLVKYVKTIEDLSDPDCAGCSDFYYHIYECVSPGTDTLGYAVIPMGAVGDATACSDVELSSVDTSFFRNYIITVVQQ